MASSAAFSGPVIRPRGERNFLSPRTHASRLSSARGPVRRHVFRKVWDAACTEAGVGHVRLEWLRHTGASLAYAASKDMKLVATRLGHTSTRMMDTVYVQLYAEASREVADAIDVMVEAALAKGRA